MKRALKEENEEEKKKKGNRRKGNPPQLIVCSNPSHFSYVLEPLLTMFVLFHIVTLAMTLTNSFFWLSHWYGPVAYST